MNNPPKKTTPSLPPAEVKPLSSLNNDQLRIANTLLGVLNKMQKDLAGTREELTNLREDFRKLNQELSIRIAFGVIGSLIVIVNS